MKHGLAVLAAVALFHAAPAMAQDAGAARTRAQQDSLARHWLRQLEVSQQRHFAERGTYTTDLSALRVGKKPMSVDLIVVQAGGRSWWGLATLGRAKCVIWVGTAADFAGPPTTGRVQAAKEREIACDVP